MTSYLRLACGEGEAADALVEVDESGQPPPPRSASGGCWSTVAMSQLHETPSNVRPTPNTPKSPRMQLGTCRQ